MFDRSPQSRKSAAARAAPLVLLGALLFGLAACESLPRDEGWSMFDRDRPSRAGS